MTDKVYTITGTYHGSIAFVKSEGDARRAFHKKYNGESIIIVKDISKSNYCNI